MATDQDILNALITLREEFRDKVVRMDGLIAEYGAKLEEPKSKHKKEERFTGRIPQACVRHLPSNFSRFVYAGEHRGVCIGEWREIKGCACYAEAPGSSHHEILIPMIALSFGEQRSEEPKSKHKKGERFEGEIEPNSEVYLPTGFSHFEYAGEHRQMVKSDWGISATGRASTYTFASKATPIKYEILIPVCHEFKVGDYVVLEFCDGSCKRGVLLRLPDDSCGQIGLSDDTPWCFTLENFHHMTPQEIRQYLTEKYAAELDGKKYLFYRDHGTIKGYNFHTCVIFGTTGLIYALIKRADIPIMTAEEYELWREGAGE